jgi:hypothetical protein
MWIEISFILLVAALMFVLAEKIRREDRDQSDPPDMIQLKVEPVNEEHEN